MPARSTHTADPYLDQGTRDYILKIANDNYKRIAGCSVEDLVQEGYFAYYKCRKRYVGRDPDSVDGTIDRYRWLPPENPDKLARRHFMALFKTTFARRIATMVWQTPTGWEQPISELVDDGLTTEMKWEELMPSEGETASATLLLASAPQEIKQLFQLLIDDAMNGIRRFGHGRRAPRETTNRYYCRQLGLDPDYDVMGAVNRHFLV